MLDRANAAVAVAVAVAAALTRFQPFDVKAFIQRNNNIISPKGILGSGTGLGDFFVFGLL